MNNKESLSYSKKKKLDKIENNSPIDLNSKIDNFIDWYHNNMIKGKYTEIGENYFLKEITNLIEKMAVWYELRYPDYEINRLMYCCAQKQTNINDVMFKNNPYINHLFNKDSDTKKLDWIELYNKNVFISSLPISERCLISNPWYSSITHLIPTEKAPFNLYLSKNGFVKKTENVSNWTNSVITDEELIGLHVKKVLELFKSKSIILPENSELEEIVMTFDNQMYCKEEILNCIMYKIIERGGNRIGPRRAFLFAKEFKRNIDIPMMYAIDFQDPGLRLFINEYIKAGGSKDLKCYIGYFSRTNKQEILDTISIQDLILTQKNNAATSYTPEKNELHQRLANTLVNRLTKKLKQN